MGKESKKEGVYVNVLTDSLCYTPEINTALYINYTPIKKFFFFKDLVLKSKDLECPGYTADGEGGRGLKFRFLIRATGRMVVSDEDRPWDRESRSVHLGGGVWGTVEVMMNKEGQRE